MKGSSFIYLVKHGIQSLWLNKLMTSASIAVLCVCLLVTGGAGMLGLSVYELFREVESRNEITVFILDEVDETGTLAIKNRILATEGVVDAVYTSREQAFENQRQQLGEDSHLLDGLDPSAVFPASYTVSIENSRFMSDVVSKLSAIEGVDSVNALLDVADTLTNVSRLLVFFGGGLALALILVSVIVISNTIRITVEARKREINIMKYVGATNKFIRLPFRVEGCFIGFISAVAAFFALYGICSGIDSLQLGSSIAMVGTIESAGISFNDIWYYILGYNIAFGVIISSIATIGSMRKHLKV